MSETIKGFIIAFVVFIVWSAGCFLGGYLLSNSRATKRINDTNLELAEQQRKYDELIKSTEERIRETEQRVSDIREQLSSKVSDNGKATEELSKLIEIIRKQKLDI